MEFLGDVVWFTVGGEVTYESGSRETRPLRVQHAAAVAWFAELGLDPKFLPPAPLAVDAFRKATSLEREYEVDPVNKLTATLVVKHVREDREQIVKQVIREVRDGRRGLLTHDRVAQIKFIRARRGAPGTHSFQAAVMPRMPELDHQQVTELVQQAERDFHDMTDSMTAAVARAIVRNYIVQEFEAISLRDTGGVYFVAGEHQDALLKLQEFVGRMGPGCSLRMVPLVDTPEQREMLAECASRATLSEEGDVG